MQFFKTFLIFLWLIAGIPGISVWAQTSDDSIDAALTGLQVDEKIDTLLALSKYNWFDHTDKSISQASEALKLAKEENDPTRTADALSVLGSAYYFHQEPYKSIENFELALSLSKEINYEKGISRASNNLGLVYDYLGDFDLAMFYYFQSLELDKSSDNKKGIASCYLNIGNIYYYLKEYDKALEFMTNSLEIYKSLNDQTGILKCYTNIGTTYIEINIPENALDYLNKALDLSYVLNDRDMQAANLNNIGKVYFQTAKYYKSLEYYNKALAIEQESKDRWSEANTLRNIGGVYMELQIPNEAKMKFDLAMSIARDVNANTLLIELYQDYATLYETKKDFANSLKYLKKYAEFKDSLYNVRSRKQIAEVENRFKLQRQSKQLELLEHDNSLKSYRIKVQNYFIIVGIIFFIIVIVVARILFLKARRIRYAKELQEKKNAEITVQKQLLESTVAELKESQEKYRSLAENVQDGLVIIQDEKVVYANTVFCDFLGYSSLEEVRQLKSKNFIAPADYTRVLRNYKNRIKGESVPENYTFHIISKSGKKIPVSMKVKLISYKGNPAVIATLKDVSTDKDWKDKLIMEKDKAEEATKSKSLFLAGMSHEIRNHMNSILGISEVLSETELDKDQQEYVNVIKISGNNLLNIINDILDFSKIEARQVILEKEIFGLKKLIQDVISLQKVNAKKRNLYLRYRIDKEVPDVLKGDPQRLSQILINLISNGLKFTDRGGVALNVKLAENKEPMNGNENSMYCLLFNIVDTGIGIASHSQSKLFKPFSQTHASVKRKLHGTGLGLAISKQLVELMDGEIGVISEEGAGSTFWFKAWFDAPGESGTGLQAEEERENKKILLVEDNVLNQQLTTNILHRGGYITDIAQNGREGFELYKKNKYSVILMDIQMPVMDGMEATKLIRDYEARSKRRKSRIIAVTAHSKDFELNRYNEVGMDDYLRKPFQPDELLDMVRTG